jgi:hypothetical protein
MTRALASTPEAVDGDGAREASDPGSEHAPDAAAKSDATSPATGEASEGLSPLLDGIAARSKVRPRATLGLARVVAWDGARLLLDVDGATVEAKRDLHLHPNVLETALRTGEVVLVAEREELTVVGALRTQPTPGIDAGESFHIRAKRVRVEATEEISLGAAAATVVLRAVGEVETYADRIVSRAEQLHKLVGRMLRLN